MTKHRRRRTSAAAPRHRRRAPRRTRRLPGPPSEKKNIALLKLELAEAREQQAATSEVLHVIASSPGDLQPVFQAMLENATRICGAKFGTLYLYDGDAFHATAFHNAPPAFIEHRKRAPLRPGPDTSVGQAARTKQVAHIIDSMKRESYRRRDPFVVAGAELGGISDDSFGAHAQGGQVSRCYQHLSSGSAGLQRKANRAGHEFLF